MFVCLFVSFLLLLGWFGVLGYFLFGFALKLGPVGIRETSVGAIPDALAQRCTSVWNFRTVQNEKRASKDADEEEEELDASDCAVPLALDFILINRMYRAGPAWEVDAKRVREFHTHRYRGRSGCGP